MISQTPSLTPSHTKERTEEKTDPLWDLPLRLFHWLLVASFTLLAISGYLEIDIFWDVHVLLGLFLTALLTFRLVWGLIGSPTSRFSSFPLSKEAIQRHIHDLKNFKSRPHAGHTPLGAVMIVLMMSLLALMCLSGLILWGSEMPNSPLAPYVSHNIGEIFEEIHEFMAGLLLGCVALHVLAILIESKIFKHNLIEGMISGHRNPDSTFDTGRWTTNLRAVFVIILLIFGVMALSSALSTPAHAGSVLDTYQADSPGHFSAERGRLLFETPFASGKAETPACTSCHGTDPAQAGQTRAGKPIEPMAFSVSPERYQDPDKVEKWFRRNCKSVLGRTCTPQEKGDFLTFMMTQ